MVEERVDKRSTENLIDEIKPRTSRSRGENNINCINSSFTSSPNLTYNVFLSFVVTLMLPDKRTTRNPLPK